MTETLDIALLPAEAVAIPADCYVVVDVLRATTTIAALFAAGLRSLLVADDIELARERARTENRLLFGEVGGLPPPEFDYGNSPVEARAAPVAGRGGVLFTTNGTRALAAVATSGLLVAGSLANASAAATFAARHDRVVVVCAGTEGGTRFALEDFAGAAAIARRIATAAPDARLGDAARFGMAMAAQPGWVETAIRTSDHAIVTARLGLQADIDFAVREDTLVTVPTGTVLENGDLWLFDALA